MSVDLLLLIGGAICFGLATFGVSAKINLTARGLLLWILTQII